MHWYVMNLTCDYQEKEPQIFMKSVDYIIVYRYGRNFAVLNKTHPLNNKNESSTHTAHPIIPLRMINR